MAELDGGNNCGKVALITGVTGQDGSYLAELLLSKGYEVHGIIRRSSSFNTGRIQHLYKDRNAHLEGNLHLHYGDLTDSSSLLHIVSKCQPTEIYHLAAQSHVKVSFDLAEYTADVDAMGTLRLLEAVKICGLLDKVKFYQASTSELYGKVREIPQNEETPFHPRSPYGVAKLYGYWIVVNYREAYNLFGCNGILFNHESPRRVIFKFNKQLLEKVNGRLTKYCTFGNQYFMFIGSALICVPSFAPHTLRGETFVTRKITRAVAKIHLGLQEEIILGNIDSVRDWGHAKDYVEAMWLMLQQEKPDDYVVATGETHTVREFVEKAFALVNVNIRWEGKGESELGYDRELNKVRIRISSKYYRPAEVEYLHGNPKKSETKLGWKRKVNFEELVKEMVESDIALMGKNPEA